jgi:hypothetical protein
MLECILSTQLKLVDYILLYYYWREKAASKHMKVEAKSINNKSIDEMIIN